MNRSALRRTAATFLFLLLSLTALAAAAPPRSALGPKARPSKRPSSIVSSLWNTLVHFWEKAGGSLDPDGKPQPSVTPNEGSSLDPSGVLPDNGGSLDPDGAK